MLQQTAAIESREINRRIVRQRVEPTLINDLLLDHFTSYDLETLVVSRREFSYWMRPDVQLELESIFSEFPQCSFYGARLRGDYLDFRFPNLLEGGDDAIAVGPVVYTDIEIGNPSPARCMLRGIWLATLGETPFALLLDLDRVSGGTQLRVEIAVPAGVAAEKLAVSLLRRLDVATATARSIRGKVLTIEGEKTGFDNEPATVKVQRLSPVNRDELILPMKVLELIERSTIGFAKRLDQLIELEMSPRRGLLLYGPPGVGKTLTIRYLAGKLQGFTTLIVPAEAFHHLSEYIDMAHRLQPAMVVLEDIDLIGGDRSGPWTNAPAMLNQLMNAMDGLAVDAKILFVLTTNRAEILEPALAGRPGRVDQAIEFGLPEDPERRLLLKRYARSLSVTDEVVEATSRRIGSVSPAFIKELMRRAALAMMDRDGQSIEMRDVEQALDDMLVMGGSLNSKLLGGPARIGFS